MSVPIIGEEFTNHNGTLANWYKGWKSYGMEVLYDRPIAFWRLNEAAGTVARGLMSSNTDGTYTGSYTLGTTGPGLEPLTATLFDGSTAYVNLTTPIALLQPTTAFTLTSWFRTATASTTLFGPNTNGLSMKINSSGFLTGSFYNGSTTTTVTSTAVVTDNTYHFAFLSYNGSTLTLWIDDGLEVSVSASGSVSYSGVTSLAIGGAGGTTQAFHGQIANIALFDKAVPFTRAITYYEVLTANETYALSFSGNEINDVERTANIQGDGLTPPSGLGIWVGTTNLNPNGGFESNTTGWTSALSTVTRSTFFAKFGTHSMEIQT